MLIQLTGLPGAGKSTLALAVQAELKKKGIAVEIIDGDVYRQTLCRDLGFSKEDRCENMRRLGRVAHAFVQQGRIAIIAAINPYEEIRQEIRENYEAKTVWLDCPLDVLIQRDPKGLYRRALLPKDHPQKINNFTGIDDPFELPEHADLTINTAAFDLQEATRKLSGFIITSLQFVVAS